MTQRTIRLGLTEVAYTLKRSSRRRTIGLRIGADGLCVTLPSRASTREAELVLREKAAWVLSRLRKWEGRPRPQPLLGLDGETVGYLGEGLRLSVQAHDRARTVITRESTALRVCVDGALEGDLRAATVLRALARWRRQEAQALMTPRIEGYARQLGQKPPPVLVRVQKTRWGSCASDGVIRMNARLIAFPEPLIDYVCAHEACHLIEMNHSPRFHALLDRVMPDHKVRSRTLRETLAPGGVF